jgi:hypothetical protein
MRIFDNISSSGKILMLLYPGYNMIPFLTDPSKAKYRMFLIASSLMVDSPENGIVMGAHTATDMTLGPYADLQPEFNLPLGKASGNRQWTGDVFLKKFQTGIILVNPNNDDRYISSDDIAKYGIKNNSEIILGDIGAKPSDNTPKNTVPQIGRLITNDISVEADGSILVPSLSAKVFVH